MKRLLEGPIDAALVEAGLRRPGFGAVVSFSGIVRDHHQGREVSGLSYSAYHEMAERDIAAIIVEVETRWPVAADVRHRLGDLQVGDVAVVAAAAGGHRSEAFEAARWLIDEIKRRVPIWKHERYVDGTSTWVGS